MKKPQKKFFNIFLRYLILIIVAIPNLWFFYFIFKPLTIYPVFFLLSLFFNASLSGNSILFNQISIEIINACIAGSAYYLLLILNLSIPKIKFNKRLKMIFLSFAFLLIANILRIFILSLIFINNPALFDITHKLSWYFGSIVFVIAIWFAEVKYFKIKEIPFYSDIKLILRQIK